MKLGLYSFRLGTKYHIGTFTIHHSYSIDDKFHILVFMTVGYLSSMKNMSYKIEFIFKYDYYII